MEEGEGGGLGTVREREGRRCDMNCLRADWWEGEGEGMRGRNGGWSRR